VTFYDYSVIQEDSEIDNKIYKSKSNENLDRKARNDSRKNSGYNRKKSGHKPNKSVIEHVDEEDMGKIISDLKYFKEHFDNSKKIVGVKNTKKNVNTANVNKRGKDVAVESGDNTTAPSQQASRPRTSRGTRTNSKIAKKADNSGGNSAMGFHSNMPQRHLLYNNMGEVDNVHNRSVNENFDCDLKQISVPKQSKGRTSPNNLIANNQRHPSAVIKQK
jgi:hypothetical protein